MLKWSVLLLLMMGVVMKMDSPLVLSGMLIIYSLMVSINISFYYSLWLFYSIILIFLGGMMVVIMYVCTLSENDKFVLNKSFFMMSALMLVSIMSMAILGNSEFAMNFSMTGAGAMYKSISGFLLFFLIVYLLLTLFLVVKFTESFKGAMMKLN